MFYAVRCGPAAPLPSLHTLPDWVELFHGFHGAPLLQGAPKLAKASIPVAFSFGWLGVYTGEAVVMEALALLRDNATWAKWGAAMLEKEGKRAGVESETAAKGQLVEQAGGLRREAGGRCAGL